MKKNIAKRTAAVAMAGIMALSSTACGGNTKTDSDKKTEASAGGKPTISFMTTAFNGTELKNEHSDEVIQKYEDYTGVHVEWKFEANDTYKEKLGLTLMDKDNMPMVIACPGQLTANVVDAAKKGAFWDLTEYLQDAEAYPNLVQANKNVLKGITINGQVVGVPRARAIGRNGFAYRTDWAEAVGITKAPQTVEEVYDMMYKFTYEDPDGNGEDDTYGLEMTKATGPLDIIQTWFGTGNEWVEKEGTMIPVHQTDEFKEALKWMRKIYEDGLIRKDWPTVDSGLNKEACQKGETGCYINAVDDARRISEYFEKNKVMSVTDSAKPAVMTLVGPVNGKTLATSGHNGYYVITKAGAKTEEDVKNCLNYLDKTGDDEMVILADYGLEGISYDLDDDGKIVVRKGELEPSQYPQVGFSQSLCYIPNRLPKDPELQMNELLLAQEETYVKNEEASVFNPAVGYLANSEVNAEVGTDIEQIIDDARTQYICGQIDDAGFDAAAKQWLDRGGDRLIEEINRLYQEDLAAGK